ncbi:MULTISPECIES: SurA N-terminal domain-containing protein [unclassified Francisella]|uniref:SurA N-terminal domain-containing protein n=1 Tax=unclassified Francisella TaxID=2610885 RepID=UPI002E30FCB5|nr:MULTISPECIES: SurA N-terminal domain-containing protein [unclassified Francisella]MED7819779.1 SurA N-terminal domain-containing protein [Francisella sp. 19S2-4]MED7830599.1 SurA N-terminal domain-containing protein [Francisella sp. 19S2-10]
MKKVFILILSIIIFTYGYCDISSSLFQNAFGPGANNSTLNQPSQSQNGKQLINKTVAIVNNKPITSFELNEEVAKLQAAQGINPNLTPASLKLKRQALQNLIAQSVLIQLAQQNNITISNSQIDKTIKDIAAKNGISEESLKLNIEAAGMSFDSYKDRIRKQLMVNQLQKQAISQQVYVSPEEIQKYIKKHQEEFDREMQPIKIYTLSNFIVALPDSKKASKNKIDQFKKLAIAVNKGLIDFSEMTKQFSQAPNASTGGQLSQQVTFDSIPEIYKSHVKDLKNHEVSQPFVVNNTLQMVYVNDLDEHAPMLSKSVKKYYVYAIEIKLSTGMTEKGAKDALDRARLAIQSGQGFAKVAEKYNQNYDHADGDFKWVSKLDTPPSLPPAAFAQLGQLKKGELSEAFQADPTTWMIIKYTKVKEYDAIKELEEQKALEAIFADKAQEVYKTWLTSIKDDAYIEILQKDLKTPELY